MSREQGDHNDKSHDKNASDSTMRVHPLNAKQMGRGWFITIGIVLTIFGLAAVIIPGLGTIGATLFIGWLLLFAGGVQCINAFVSQRGMHAFWQIVIAIITIIAGGWLIFEPIEGAYAVTLLLSFYFLLTGLMRILVGAKVRTRGTGWIIVSGIVNLFLAVLIWALWPSDAFWVPGVIVGIDLIFAGWSMLMLGSIPTGLLLGDIAMSCGNTPPTRDAE